MRVAADERNVKSIHFPGLGGFLLRLYLDIGAHQIHELLWRHVLPLLCIEVELINDLQQLSPGKNRVGLDQKFFPEIRGRVGSDIALRHPLAFDKYRSL